MNVLKNKNRIANEIRSGLELVDSDFLYSFGNDEDAVTCGVQFNDVENYLIVVSESGHFYINQRSNPQNFLLRAFLKSEDDISFIAPTLKLVFQVDVDEQFL